MQKGHAFKPLMRAGLTTLLLGSALAVNAQNAIVKGVVKDTSGGSPDKLGGLCI